MMGRHVWMLLNSLFLLLQEVEYLQGHQVCRMNCTYKSIADRHGADLRLQSSCNLSSSCPLIDIEQLTNQLLDNETISTAKNTSLDITVRCQDRNSAGKLIQR